MLMFDIYITNYGIVKYIKVKSIILYSSTKRSENMLRLASNKHTHSDIKTTSNTLIYTPLKNGTNLWATPISKVTDSRTRMDKQEASTFVLSGAEENTHML